MKTRTLANSRPVNWQTSVTFSPAWLLVCAALLAAAWSARAQWRDQTFTLKPGWNAVYFHVDAGYDTLDTLVGGDAANPISEIWKWQPAVSTVQFVQTPQEPTIGNSQWSSWVRDPAVADTLNALSGNAAYLVKNTNSVDYAWTVRGRPLAPVQQWTVTGLNLAGFPVAVNGPPSFDNFLSPAPDLLNNAEIYHYPGGELGSGNPARLLTLLTTPVTRGQAYWIRAGTSYNRYFGPFELALQSGNSVNFYDTAGQYRIRLRNITATERTVSMFYLAGSPPPEGVPEVISGTPPLLLRGDLNTADLTYGYEPVVVDNANPAHEWVLQPQGQPGSEVEIVLGLDRSGMTEPAGSLYAGILQFKDPDRLAVVEIGVSATVASRGGLWVGGAAVTQVQHYLKDYEKDAFGNLVTQATTNGEPYVVTSTDTSLGGTSRSFPLRLILHADAAGAAKLLQRAYYGLDGSTNLVLATQQGLLDQAQLSAARRISAAHLPWTADNTPWDCTGVLGDSLVVTVPLAYDDQRTNPFLHTYHPDHDNLDSGFSVQLAQGSESYGVRRRITLTFATPPDDFTSLTSTGTRLTGEYDETVTLLGTAAGSRDFQVKGVFTLNRVSDIASLILP